MASAKRSEKRDAFCVLCGNKIGGEYQGVLPTLCCLSCCTEQHSEEEMLIVKTDALRRYRLRPQDLQQLCCLSKRNPKHKFFAPMQLYLRTEVEHLGELRAEELKEKRATRVEREMQDLLKKKRTLVKKWGAALTEMDPVLRHFMLGDYLKNSRGASIKFKEVLQRFAVRDRVSEILKRCPRAHPASAFDFCLKYSEGGPKEFSETKTKMRKALDEAGMRIMHCLGSDDRSKLKGTPLEQLVKDFDGRNSRAMVKNYLERKTTEAVATAIMKHPACLTRLFRGGIEERVADKLLKFWNEKDDPDKRRFQLVSALEAKNIKLPSKWYRVNDYIHGRVDVDLEEMVAWCQLRRELKSQLIGDSSRRADAAEYQMRKCLYEQNLGYEVSIQKAVVHALKIRVPDYEDDYMDTDTDTESDD